MNDEQMYYYLMEEHAKSRIDNKIIRAIFIGNTPQAEV